jgi:microcystin-dependent protein
MAVQAKWRDDISGAIVTGGTSTAYTVASYSAFDSLAHMSGQLVAFSPHTTNTGTTTLSVDGLGAKPLRSAPSTEILSGTLIQGTPYLALYSNSDAAWYLHGFYGNAYNVPLMGGMDYWDTIAPNSSFIFPAGQAISRTTYAAVFARWGTTYGVGDGSTTFNVPDKTERVSVMKASSASRLTSTYFGGNSTVMGATGGSESTTLTAAQIPSITSTASVVSPARGYLTAPVTGFGLASFSANAGAQVWQAFSQGASIVIDSAVTSTGTATSNNTSGNAHRTVQPTIVCNYIIRVL